MDRPLPYLIGSQAFMEQDDVGLGDLSSDGNILMATYSGTHTYNMYSVRFPHVCVQFSLQKCQLTVTETV